MTTPSQRRLLRDLLRLKSDPPPGVMGSPVKDDVMNWEAVIFGPQDTAYEYGTFRLRLNFTEEYPNKPPQVVFLSKVFHPNVYTDGSICLDILTTNWSPIYDVSTILTSIQCLLGSPNANSPANSVAAGLYLENRREYEKRVRACIDENCQEDVLPDDES